MDKTFLKHTVDHLHTFINTPLVHLNHKNSERPLFMCNGSVFVSTAGSGDPWGQCPVNRKCKDKFGDGSCDRECMEPECLRDGFDCLKDRGHCK